MKDIALANSIIVLFFISTFVYCIKKKEFKQKGLSSIKKEQNPILYRRMVIFVIINIALWIVFCILIPLFIPDLYSDLWETIKSEVINFLYHRKQI